MNSTPYLFSSVSQGVPWVTSGKMQVLSRGCEHLKSGEEGSGVRLVLRESDVTGRQNCKQWGGGLGACERHGAGQGARADLGAELAGALAGRGPPWGVVPPGQQRRGPAAPFCAVPDRGLPGSKGFDLEN